MCSKIFASRIELRGEIFDTCGEIELKYFFAPCCGEAELPLPFFPHGIISDFFVICDGEECAKAAALRLRELPELTQEKRVSLSFKNETPYLTLLGINAKESLCIKLSVCVEIPRHNRHSTLIFQAPAMERLDIDADIRFHGDIRTVTSPTHPTRITAADGTQRVFTSGSFCGTLVFDIFYEDNLKNTLTVSRHPFRKNIALCAFAPKFTSLRRKKQCFDINVSFLGANRLEIISAATAFFRCLNPEHNFNLTIGKKTLFKALPATEENKDAAVCALCDTQNTEALVARDKGANSVIVCHGGVYDEGLKLFGKPLLIFVQALPCEMPKFDYTFASFKNDENIIAAHFSKLYDKTLAPASLKSVGGLGVELVPSKVQSLTANSLCHCFAKHDILPPAGLRIFNNRHKLIEEISFDAVNTYNALRPIDVMYAKALIKELKARAEAASPEDICLYRQEIDDICLLNGIANEDVALVCFIGGKAAGLLSHKSDYEKLYEKYFRESDFIDSGKVLDLILKNQTVDGIIAEADISRPDQAALSTALCLIALYLCGGEKHRAFARRSLKFLANCKGYWASTAISLWNGEEIDFAELYNRLEMKIMNERLFELSVLIIKNHRRNLK